MAAARLPTVDQMTGTSWESAYLSNVPHPMATAEAVDTSGEAVYQFVPRQNFQPGFDYSTSSGRPLGWGDASRAHADAYTSRVEIGACSSHGGHEPVQHIPWVELHPGLLEDTASRSEYQPGCVDPYPGNDQERVLLSFPEGEDDAVTIRVRDRDGLQPQTFLGNSIIDFYIKYLERGLPSEERNRFYSFNSFFFTKLLGSSSASSEIDRCDADYDQVRKWARDVNLFEKDYVFIPVLRSSHWSLIIICNLSSVASTPEKRKGLPRILHLDPVEGLHESFEGQVRRYLYRACRERYRGSSEKDDMLEALACNMKYVRAEVPRQDNSYDCGVYVLHYVEVFLRASTSPGFRFATGEEVAHVTSPHFAVEVSAKREAIQNLIYELSANPQVQAGRRVDVQPRPQPNAAKACSPRPEAKRWSKRPKGPNKISKKWEKEETWILLNRLVEGGRIRKGPDGATHWDVISQEIMTECGTVRSDDECRRRYDTLLKAFKKIEKTGKPLRDITDRERRELNLATPLREESWYEAIGRICVQRSSESKSSGKRAKLNASEDTGMLSFRPPAPSVPSGRAQTERRTQKQVAVPEFRSLGDDVRSTLLNLIQASSMKEWSNWRDEWTWGYSHTADKDFSEMEVICQRLAIVEDREPSHIRRLVLKLLECKLVTVQVVIKDIFLEDERCLEAVPCLNLLNLRVYKKFVEKVVCKNPDFNTYLQIRKNHDSVSFPEVPLQLSLQRIRVLSLWKCGALEHADLSNFRELRSLYVYSCENLKAITGWAAVNDLGWLEIRGCSSYADLPPVHCLPSLREFFFDDFRSFSKDSVLENAWEPDFSQCVRLRTLEIRSVFLDALVLKIMGLSTLRFLEVLRVTQHSALTTLEGLSGLLALTHLDLVGFMALRRVPELGCLKALTHLDMRDSGVEEIPGVQELHLLTSLVLYCCESLIALPWLGHLKALARLNIGMTGVEEIPGVQHLVSLETLWCTRSELKRLPDLFHLPQLREVSVGGTPLSKESDPSSFYYGKDTLSFNSKEERTLRLDVDISDVSDTE